MACYLCAKCERAYPMESEFRRCEPCGLPCKTAGATAAFTREEARSLFHHAKFDRLCKRYDELRADKGWPTPEERAQAMDLEKVLRCARETRLGREVMELEESLLATDEAA